MLLRKENRGIAAVKPLLPSLLGIQEDQGKTMVQSRAIQVLSATLQTPSPSLLFHNDPGLRRKGKART